MHWRNDEIDIESKFIWRTHLSRWRGILLPFLLHIWPIYFHLTPVRYTIEHSFGLSYKTGKNNLRHTLEVTKCCCCYYYYYYYHFNLFLKKKKWTVFQKSLEKWVSELLSKVSELMRSLYEHECLELRKGSGGVEQEASFRLTSPSSKKDVRNILSLCRWQ